jgi:hypothetical protein
MLNFKNLIIPIKYQFGMIFKKTSNQKGDFAGVLCPSNQMTIRTSD